MLLPRTPRPPCQKTHGFTLIEVLVALSILALIALMSWRGIDGMAQTQAATQRHSAGVLALQAGLAQWQADLDATWSPEPAITAHDWDGRTLRLTRQITTAPENPISAGLPNAGLQVVAWSRREIDGLGQWLRWQSAPVRTRAQWQTAWQQAAAWTQTPSADLRRDETVISPLQQWELFYYRGNTWSHPLSSGVVDAAAPGSAFAANPAGASAPSTTRLPDGVRLVLTLPAGQSVSGTLVQDWVQPTLGGNKS